VKIDSSFKTLQPQSAEQKAAKVDGQLREAAKMYEGYFLNEMVRAMRSTIPRDENSPLKQSFAEKIFEGQLDQQYVENWSNKGGIGLADMIHQQISEKYLATAGKKSFLPQGPLPIAPKKEMLQVPADSIQMKAIKPGPEAKLEYRFEVPTPTGGTFEAQAPGKGTVSEARTIGEGWNLVKLDHGQGMSSEMTFPGKLAENVLNTEVEPGQKLGVLDSSRPVLAWKLDWT
jgi:Rod binding domain-containing protein